jgi:predicted glycoside hydrolase/deacetylase ChbG (UPF0249 family)
MLIANVPLHLDVQGRYLIVHADDLGMAHSINAATIRAFKQGLVTSASIMVPCAWFPEIAEFARTNREVDLGIHLTLTCERTSYRWKPVSPRDQVPSLVDEHGCFQSRLDVAAKWDIGEVELEVRAQIDRALSAGVAPTHLDSHRFWPFERTGRQLFDIFRRASLDYDLPFFVSKDWCNRSSHLRSCLQGLDFLVDRTILIEPGTSSESWEEFYCDAIANLPPGVSQLLVHLAFDDDEMRAMTADRATWGAEWRQRDFDFCTGSAFKRLILEQNITLLNWRDFAGALRSKKG